MRIVKFILVTPVLFTEDISKNVNRYKKTYFFVFDQILYGLIYMLYNIYQRYGLDLGFKSSFQAAKNK